MYGYIFLSRRFTDQREVQPHLRQVFSHFGGIAPGTAEFWASTGAIWRGMLLAEAVMLSVCLSICKQDSKMQWICMAPYYDEPHL